MSEAALRNRSRPQRQPRILFLDVDGLRGAPYGGFACGTAIDFMVLGGLAAIPLAIGA